MDKLKHILYGFHCPINEKISLCQPTLRQVIDYGEREYLVLVHGSLTGRPYDYMVELDEQGIDFEELDEFQFFAEVLSRSVKQSGGSLFVKGFNFEGSQLVINQENQKLMLYDQENGTLFDELCYRKMVEYIRTIHHLSHTPEYSPGNALAKRKLIESEKRKRQRKIKKDEEPESGYLNFISSLVNSSECKYNYETILDLTIAQFFDVLYRILRIKNHYFTMIGCYAGTVDSSKLDKDAMNWLGNLST